MPKVSKARAASHMQVPGVMEAFGQQADGWTIGVSTFSMDVDGARLCKGAPGDQCHATHLGYVIKGKMAIRTAGGAEEVFEAGDAFYVAPGHTPFYFAGLEVVDFTSTEDSNREFAVMVPNIKKYLEEEGMEVPPDLQALAH